MQTPLELLDDAIKAFELAGVHPAANLFPMMSTEELDALIADVDAHGFINSVKITDDLLVIDGRNRLVASLVIGLDVRLERHNPLDPISYVLGENLHRRNLSAGQKALVGVEAEKLYAAEAKKKQLSTLRQNQNSTVGTIPSHRENSQSEHDNKSATRAAKLVGVGSTTMKKAKKVSESDPFLTEQVRTGEIAIDKAYSTVKFKEQNQPIQDVVKPSNEKIMLETARVGAVAYPKPKGKSQFNKTNDAVGWASYTWNPVTGCLHGCNYCYAREIATSFSMRDAYPIGFEPVFHHERLEAPTNTYRPDCLYSKPELGRVFVCSMADLFGAWVPQDWIEQVMDAAIAAPQWEYLFLTKFPQRLHRLKLPSSAWIGASIDSAHRADPTIEALKKVQGVKVRWLSVEPMLTALPNLDLSDIDWLVIGAQSGTTQPGGVVPGFAPNFEWVMDLVEQARAYGAAVYLKSNLLGKVNNQWPGMILPQELPANNAYS